MPVIINEKICDNAEECGGVEVCSVGALVWDKEGQKIGIDNKKCVECGLCVDACPVGAIKVAKNNEEYEEIRKEIKNDPRKINDLFIDRYGADPIHPAFLITRDQFDLKVLQQEKTVMLEVFHEDSVECLLKSIPVKTLLNEKENVDFKKIKKSDDFLDEYGIENLPALLFFKNGKMTGKIEGYYDIDQKDELINRINKIIG